MSILKGIVNAFFSVKTARRIGDLAAILRGRDYGLLQSPTFNDDGLVTFHVCRFMDDPRFLRAYSRGVETGSLRTHPGGIQWRVYVACWAAERAIRLNGDFCECGVSLGLLSRAIVEYVQFDREKSKTFYLFDTFSGIPSDVLSADERSKGVDNSLFGYEECYEQVRQTFSGYENVRIIRGKVPESLSACESSSIAYLSIDMNNAYSEIAAAEFFWEKLVSGAVVVLDDYAYSDQFSAQHDAFDKFCEARGVSVLALPTGQGLIFKP